MSAQLADDVNTAATITWQQALLAAGKALPEPELDKRFLLTERGKAALALMRQAGVNPKLPWAPPLWSLTRELNPRAGKKTKPARAVATEKPATKKPAAKKPAKKTTKAAGFIDKIIRRNNRITVAVATEEKRVGSWSARGETQMRAVLKKALAQAHLLAKRGYETCIAVTHEDGATTVQCWPE